MRALFGLPLAARLSRLPHLFRRLLLHPAAQLIEVVTHRLHALRLALRYARELHLVLLRQVHDALLEPLLQLGGRLLAPGGLQALGLQLHTQLLDHRVLCARGATLLGAQLLELPTRRRMRALFGLPLAARLSRLPLLLRRHLARLGCLGLHAPEGLHETPLLRESRTRCGEHLHARQVISGNQRACSA